jgi:hypothetical protein
MFPLFSRPRGRIESLPLDVDPGRVVVDRSVNNSLFLLGITGVVGKAEEAGIEMPTTEEVGRELGF